MKALAIIILVVAVQSNAAQREIRWSALPPESQANALNLTPDPEAARERLKNGRPIQITVPNHQTCHQCKGKGQVVTDRRPKVWDKQKAEWVEDTSKMRRRQRVICSACQGDGKEDLNVILHP